MHSYRYPATLSGLQEFFDGIHEARSPQATQLGVPGHHGDSEGMYTCIVLDEFHKYFASMLQVDLLLIILYYYTRIS